MTTFGVVNTLIGRLERKKAAGGQLCGEAGVKGAVGVHRRPLTPAWPHPEWSEGRSEAQFSEASFLG